MTPKQSMMQAITQAAIKATKVAIIPARGRKPFQKYKDSTIYVKNEWNNSKAANI